MSLAEGKMPTGCPVTPPPGTAPPLASLIALVPGTMPPSAFPHGLDPVARTYASSISTSMSAYEELSGHHLRSTLDLIASTPASEYWTPRRPRERSSVRLPFVVTTSETHDLTCTRYTTILALRTPNLPMTATT
jgi:hypothetical protein